MLDAGNIAAFGGGGFGGGSDGFGGFNLGPPKGSQERWQEPKQPPAPETPKEPSIAEYTADSGLPKKGLQAKQPEKPKPKTASKPKE